MGLLIQIIPLLRRHSMCRSDGAGGRHRRDRERQPRIPSRRPVGRIEFAVSFQIEVALPVSNRKQKSDLRTDANGVGAETVQDRAGSALT